MGIQTEKREAKSESEKPCLVSVMVHNALLRRLDRVRFSGGAPNFCWRNSDG